MIFIRWSGWGLLSIAWFLACVFGGVGIGSGGLDLGFRGTCAVILGTLVVGAVPAFLVGFYVFNRRPSFFDTTRTRHTAFGLPMEVWTLCSHGGTALLLACVVITFVVPTYVAVILFFVLIVGLPVLAGIFYTGFLPGILHRRYARECQQHAQELGVRFQAAKRTAAAVCLTKVGLRQSLTEALQDWKFVQMCGLFEGKVFTASITPVLDPRSSYTRMFPRGSDEQVHAIALPASLPDITIRAKDDGQWAIHTEDPAYARELQSVGVLRALTETGLPNVAICGRTMLTGKAVASIEHKIPAAELVRTLRALTAVSAHLSADLLARFGEPAEDKTAGVEKQLLA